MGTDDVTGDASGDVPGDRIVDRIDGTGEDRGSATRADASVPRPANDRCASATGDPAADVLGEDAARLLAAVLEIDSDRARTIRAGTARPRPRPQIGPTADHGAE